MLSGQSLNESPSLNSKRVCEMKAISVFRVWPVGEINKESGLPMVAIFAVGGTEQRCRGEIAETCLRLLPEALHFRVWPWE